MERGAHVSSTAWPPPSNEKQAPTVRLRNWMPLRTESDDLLLIQERRGSREHLTPSDPWHRPRPPHGMNLFPHQQAALDALEEWFASDRGNGVLCLPTGAGKTRTAAAFALEHVLTKSEQPVLWLAHRTELIDQAIATFERLGRATDRPLTVGRWHRERTTGQVDVLVASIPTLTFGYRQGGRSLARLLEAHPAFSLIVVDECHHGVAETWTWLLQELRARVPNVRALGLSATPTRHAEQEQPLLWSLFQKVVYEEPILGLIEAGVLARPTVIPIDTGASFDATKAERLVVEHGGELPLSLIERIAASETRNDAVADAYLERRDDWGQTLVFAATVKQARQIAAKLRARNVLVTEAYAKTRAIERTQAIEDFRAKRARVLVNVGLFTEGTDLPGVETLFLARPTKSRVLFQQMVGRGMRGPRTGGGESVTVVTFFDNIVSQLKERLTTSFTSEQEALLALGFPGERLRPSSASAPAEEDPALDRLTRVVRSLLAEGGGAQVGEALPLRGFWEVWTPQDSVCLPVFGSQLKISAWVNYLRYQCRLRGEPVQMLDDLRLPATVVVPFIRLALTHHAKVRWVNLESAERGELLAAADALERTRPAEIVTAEPAKSAAARRVLTPEMVVAKLRAAPRSEWRKIVEEQGGGSEALFNLLATALDRR